VTYPTRKPSLPRYLFGQEIGHITILAHHDWRTHPTTGRGDHRYRVQCRCGTTLLRGQQWLRKGERNARLMCPKCVAKARRGKWTGVTSMNEDAIRQREKYERLAIERAVTVFEPNPEVMWALGIMAQHSGAHYARS